MNLDMQHFFGSQANPRWFWLANYIVGGAWWTLVEGFALG
jgi:hypothetical protein